MNKTFPDPPSAAPAGLRPRTARIVILVVTALVFAPLVRHDFGGLDDALNVAHNPDLNPPTWHGLMRYWRGPAYALYIPVTYTAWFATAAVSYALHPDAAGAHLSPLPFHLLNIVLHVLSALAMFELLRRTVRSAPAALVGALLFALHPVQVEPVAWIAGTKDVLAGMLAIVALWQYLAAGQSERRARAAMHWMIGTLAFLLAMLSKPSAVIVPAIAMVLDRHATCRPWTRAALRALPWFALAVPCIIWTRQFQDVPLIERSVALWQRPLIAADALAFYFAKLVWPARLAVDYGRNPDFVIRHGLIRWTWIVPLALVVAVLLVRRRAPVVAVSVAVFILALLPVLGLIPFDFQVFSTVADHYLYLALLGPALLAAWAAARWPRMIPAAAMLLCALGIRSMLQTRHWRDAFAIFQHGIAVNPDSWTAHIQLGMNYARVNHIDKAIDAYAAAADIRRHDVVANMNLANLLADQNRYPEAIEHYKAALNNDPPSPLVYTNLALVQEELGHFAEAAENYRNALKRAPGMPEAQAGLGRVEAKLRSGPPTTRP